MSVEAGGVSKKATEENKTGSWRIFRPNVTDKCIGCGTCIDFCPEGAIKIEDKRAKINYDYCKGCLICKEQCPIKAIESEQD